MDVEYLHPMNRRRNRDLDDEIQAHLRLAHEDRIARGQTPDEAAGAVRREFGNLALVKEITREMWAWTSLERLWRDAGTVELPEGFDTA